MNKNRIISERGYACESCGISSWLDKPIVLELDHIDGDHKNNDKSNLRLLCPNCHSQTPTWRGRNKNNGASKVSDLELLTTLSSTSNIRQALMSVGLAPKGGNYRRASSLYNLTQSKPIDTTNSQFGTCWIHKNNINKKIKKDQISEYLSLGWIQGRIVTVKPPSGKNRVWITNGTHDRFISNQTTIPDGWWKGRSVYRAPDKN